MLLLSKLCLASVVVLSQPGGATTGPQDSLPPELQAARSALDAGDIEQAIELAEHYQRRNRRDPRGYLMVGDAYAQRMPAGRFRAIRAYREAERLDRTNPEPPYRIGMIGFAIGGADGERLAADGLSRALGKDPLYRDAWTIWLRLLMEDERYAEADSLLALSLATDSTNVALAHPRSAERAGGRGHDPWPPFLPPGARQR